MEPLFDKKFIFQADEFTKLDNIDGHYFSTPLWELAQGTLLKNDLDEIRSRLNDKDLLSWGKHTSRTDLASFIMREAHHIQPSIKNEFFTRAWLKLFEMLKVYPLIDLNSETIDEKGINSLFLCETPGSFVNAANYYVKSSRPGTRFNWMATSMNPYYEQVDVVKTIIDDDRFIKGKSTYDNWFFGENDVGDLMDTCTIKEICVKFRERKADFITGDGGISCVDQPEEQEQLSFPLIFSQFITAINCLRPGGNFILKTFNLFWSQSLSLLYLINSLFKQVNCFKPVLSKSGNSEIYVICIELLPGKSNLIHEITSQYFDKLSTQENIFSSLSLLDQAIIPTQFTQQFIDCSTLFKDYQKATIINNLEIFDSPNRQKIYNSLDRSKRNVSLTFLMERYPIANCNPDEQLGFVSVSKNFQFFNYNCYSLTNLISSNESYEKRKSSMGIISNEQISTVIVNLYNRETEHLSISAIDNFREIPNIRMKLGKPFTTIKNSRFVDKYLLHLYNLVTSDQSKKIHKVDYVKSKYKQTKMKLKKIFSPTFKAKFAYLIAPKSSPIVRLVLKVLSEMKNYPKYISRIEKFRPLVGKKCIIIDPFDYSDLHDCTYSLSIVEQEQNLIEKLVNQLINYLVVAKPDDILIVHSCSVLSRLMVELIYLLTSLFACFSIVPNFSINHPFEDNNKILQKNVQLGMIIVFENNSLPDEFISQRTSIISILDNIKETFSQIRGSDKTLLEIFPIIEIFQSNHPTNFYQNIFAGNFIQLTGKMESILKSNHNKIVN